MRSLTFAAVTAIVLAGGVAGAQSAGERPEALPAFDVVSIKIATENSGAAPPAAPNRYQKTRVSLDNLLLDAFGYQRRRIIGLPDWNGSLSFEVSATAAAPLTSETKKLMIQRMLAERFALRTHIESRELPYYELSRARADGPFGPRLSRTAVDCEAIRAERARNGEVGLAIPRTPGAEKPVCGSYYYTMSYSDGRRSLRFLTSGTTMESLANFLSGPADRVVIDRTELSGDFDADLEFSVLNGAASDNLPSLFSAVEEQLGLRLKSERGPIDVLVIEEVSRPEAN